MKKNTLILIGFSIFTALLGNAQTTTFNPNNARDGENVEYCITHKKMNELKSNPEYLKAWIKEQEETTAQLKKGGTEKAFVYKIPVVFHVLHDDGAENISDEQILDQVAILNRDFRLQNADANNVHADFQGMPADSEIEFVLATIAPNGACFTGITRTISSLAFDGSDGGNQVSAIVSGNDVYNGQWPGDDYLNVFIVAEAGGAAGYTTNPSNWSNNDMTNGIWILHNYVGSIGTSSIGTSRAFTHEVGHWLNLSHTWGGNNNPGNASSCGTDDNVQDTPNCIGVTSCAINSNTCNSDDAYWGFPMRDNVENYMDYSYCSKMFTAGQVSRMRAALEVNSTGRRNLWQPANLAATGATGTASLCKADFSASKTTVCVGEVVQFTDDSYNAVTGWTWSFPSGTPSSSNSQNPVVTYSTPGIYQVTLTATDGTISDAEVKTQYIKVYASSSTIPFFDGFESYTSFAGTNNWQTYNLNNNTTFVIDNAVSHSGMKCAKLANFGQSGTNLDELIAYPVDLSGVTAGSGGVTLSFRYAHRKRLSADSECLKVFITSNCGDTWAQRKTICGTVLSSTAVSTSWAPSSASDWTTIHMTNITSEYWVDNFNYKFRFDGANGNNLYLDDINIYSGGPSDNIVVNVAELDEIDGLSLYPNPAENEVNLQFSVKDAKTVQVQIQDVSGKIIQYHNVNAAVGANLVMMDTQTLSSGVYFVAIKSGDSQKVLQFVIK